MNLSLSRRLLRLALGTSILLAPLVMLLSTQVVSSSTSIEGGVPAYLDASLSGAFTSSETETAVAATQTYTASQTAIAATQTAIPATQTAVAAAQTAVAATQTAEAQPTSTARFIDAYEPNDTLATAYTTSKGTALPGLTLWPVGDVDFFRFYGKAGSAYQVFTRDLMADLDTVLTAYDINGAELATNDDYLDNKRDSRVTFTANLDGYYFVKIVNKAPTDPANKTFILEVKEVDPPTPVPTQTRVLATDACDTSTRRNDSYGQSCLILADEGNKAYDFVPAEPWLVDEDFFRMWVRQGYLYTCRTTDLSSLADTVLAAFDVNGTNIGGNDNRAPGDFGSEFQVHAWYTGWMTFQIRPAFAPEYDISSLYTYKFGCSSLFATLTPTPTETPVFSGPFPTRRPTVTSTPLASTTPATPPTAIVLEPTPVTPTPRPDVQVLPLPTATPTLQSGGPQLQLNITVYYDENVNFTPEINEGIMDLAVSLTDMVSGQLLAFGYTNEAGMIHFGPLAASGTVRMDIPFLSFSRLITSGQSDILVRVSPANLPGNIP